MDPTNSTASNLRKRGRPKGKNRVPLTLEERKARNAFYERQRRGDYTGAVNDLSTALECPNSMSENDVLRAASCCIKTLTPTDEKENLDYLRRVNDLLLYQIEKLCPQLGISVDDVDTLEVYVPNGNANGVPEEAITRPDKRPLHENNECKINKKGRKRRKLEISHHQTCTSQAVSLQPAIPDTNGQVSESGAAIGTYDPFNEAVLPEAVSSYEDEPVIPEDIFTRLLEIFPISPVSSSMPPVKLESS